MAGMVAVIGGGDRWVVRGWVSGKAGRRTDLVEGGQEQRLTRRVRGAPPGWGARASSLGLCAGGQLAGLAEDTRVLPQGAEKPDLGGEELAVGELVQQLLTWRDRARAACDRACARGGPPAEPGPAPTFPEAAVGVPALDLAPLELVVFPPAVLDALPALAFAIGADSAGARGGGDLGAAGLWAAERGWAGACRRWGWTQPEAPLTLRPRWCLRCRRRGPARCRAAASPPPAGASPGGRPGA